MTLADCIKHEISHLEGLPCFQDVDGSFWFGLQIRILLTERLFDAFYPRNLHFKLEFSGSE